jgi:hypothetical protein
VFEGDCGGVAKERSATQPVAESFYKVIKRQFTACGEWRVWRGALVGEFCGVGNDVGEMRIRGGCSLLKTF